ncbi:hypothetical protein Pcac1_g3448 [Phytophthora cactorum]|nr:hypothetical protein Pcac1_g3448 [Phytophthora cactorum]
MVRLLRELTHRIRKVFQSHTVPVTMVHQFRELMRRIYKGRQLQAVAVMSACQLRELTRPYLFKIYGGRRRGGKGTSNLESTQTPPKASRCQQRINAGVDDAASSVGGCKRPTPEKLACSRAAGLDYGCLRKEADGYENNGNLFKAGPG